MSTWLANQSGAAHARIIDPPVLLPGGAVQQNWALDVDFSGGTLAGRQHLVLRTNFQTPLPASRPKAEEFAVLRAISAAGVAVPEPLWLCGDVRVIGRAFFVMRRLPGDAAARPLIAAAARHGFGGALAAGLARQLAAIHALAPGDPRLAFLDRPPVCSALAQITAWRDWLGALAPASATLLSGLDWLERHAPAQRRTSLVHGDFRSGNYLVDDGRLVAVLDWEFAGWGDPHADIGWFCAACWRAGADHLAAGGLASRKDFYAAYEAASGRHIDVDAVAYWEVMAHVRWAIIARQQGARAAQGDVPQHELLEAAERVPGLERAVADIIAAA